MMAPRKSGNDPLSGWSAYEAARWKFRSRSRVLRTWCRRSETLRLGPDDRTPRGADHAELCADPPGDGARRRAVDSADRQGHRPFGHRFLKAAALGLGPNRAA